MADSTRRYAREAYLAGKGTVGGGLSAEELKATLFRRHLKRP